MAHWINRLLWGVYVALLGVLLPHTAWAFGTFEPEAKLQIGGHSPIAWFAAFAFEASIAGLTYKLVQIIESVPNRRVRSDAPGRERLKVAWSRWSAKYLNIYSLGLLIAVGISALANWSHAVEYTVTTEVVRRFPALETLLPIAFGAILPGVSFLFAHVLADVSSRDVEVDSETEKVKAELREVKRELRAAQQEATDAQRRADEADTRFKAAGDILVLLAAESKKQRILAARERWPELPPASIAIITETSPSYVSRVLSDGMEIDG